ncbi:profilin-like [Haliotis rufescens]|uniref:profilin-like n=1 Tax=Haliotis rufescens TaxID=6454 RepID=UPI001EB00B0D|nr:profilin-like [Haliotis rufescens]
MSWQAYIDRLAQSGVEKAAIYGKNGAVWGTSPNFSPSPDEVAVIVDAVCHNDQSIFTTGVRLGGKQWTVIRMEKESDMLILKGKDQETCKQNMICAASNTALIMGANMDEKVQAGNVRVAVEGLRDYLKTNQY